MAHNNDWGRACCRSPPNPPSAGRRGGPWVRSPRGLSAQRPGLIERATLNRSPDARQQAIANDLPIGIVALEVAREQPLLANDASAEEKNERSADPESPRGAEQQWTAQKHQGRGKVHRMSDETVDPGGDNPLIAVALDAD